MRRYINSALRLTGAQLVRVPTLEGMLQSIARLESELQDSRLNISNLQLNLENTQESASRLQLKLQEAEQEIVRLQSQLQDSRETVSNLARALQISQESASRLQSDLHLSNEGASRLESELRGSHQAGADLRSELQVSRESVTKLQSELSSVRAEMDELRARQWKPLTQAIIEQHIGLHTPPLTPDRFTALCRAYDMLTEAADRELVSRALMTRVAVEPWFGRLMIDPSIKKVRTKHELHSQMAAAIEFSDGHLENAAKIMRDLVEQMPTPFNTLTLARALKADGRIDQAVKVLNAGIARWENDLFLVMELATTFWQEGNSDRANTLLAGVKDQFETERQSLEPLQCEIKTAIEQKLLEKSSEQDIYTEDFVVATWWYYWRSYQAFNRFQDGHSSLDYAMRRELTKLLESDPSITTFIDFGAFCAHTIAKLAEEFPRIRFVGVDRPAVAKRLNEAAYPRNNVEFVADDIMHYLSCADLGSRPVLFHARTACFCYPEFLRRFYRVCHEKGIGQIFCAEWNTLSRWWLHFYPQGSFPEISVAGRGSTFLHDYKTLLREAGYSVVGAHAVQPTLLLDDRSGFGADHRLYHAVASR